ncbi:MAG: PAS domain S-box protein, partial [Terriglobia bacterium]
MAQRQPGKIRRTREERYRLLLDSTAVGIFGIDAAAACTFANASCLRLLGYSKPEEMLGRNMHLTVHHSRPDGSPYPGEDCSLSHPVQAREQVPFEDEVLWRKDGTSFPAECWSHPVIENHKVTGAVVTFLDNTERKKVEKALRESEERLREFAETIDEVFWMVDATSGQVLYVSPAYEEIWGRTGESLYEQPASWRESVFPDDRERASAMRRKPLQGETSDDEYRIVRPDGDVRWIRDCAFPVRDRAGGVSRVVGIAKDVTEWKRAGAALRRSEGQYRILFEQNVAGVCRVARGGELIETNEAMAEMLGYSSPDQLTGRNARELYYDKDDRDLLWAHLEREGKVNNYEVRLRHKDGSPVWILANLGLLKGGAEEKEVAQATFLNITERKRLQVGLLHAQKLEAVGSLAAGIAHELNTPIQFVGDNIRFLQEAFAASQRLLGKYREVCRAAQAGPVEPSLLESVLRAEEAEESDYYRDEVPKSLTQTLDGVNRVATIVSAMKDFAHPGHSEMSAADLNRALESTLIVARNEIKYVADVETDFGDLPAVFCNLGDLNQVFLNLFVNAAHAIGAAANGTGQR